MGLVLGSREKHSVRNLLPAVPKVSGSAGTSEHMAIWYICAFAFERSYHGGCPVAISTNVAPRDQISAALQLSTSSWPNSCRTTSGAMKHGVPVGAATLDPPLVLLDAIAPSSTRSALTLDRHALPKSANLTTHGAVSQPSLSFAAESTLSRSRRLPPLMSRWVMPAQRTYRETITRASVLASIWGIHEAYRIVLYRAVLRVEPTM